MDVSQTPTKGNYISAQTSLKMATQGYDLLDRKRKLLYRELSSLQQKKQALEGNLEETFAKAYAALQEANITMGIERVEAVGQSIHEDDGIDVKFYSVMGVEIPVVGTKAMPAVRPSMSFYHTNLSLDEARFLFNKAKYLVLQLAELENGMKRLTVNIAKTQKRANALKNIMIPRYRNLVAFIGAALEEKEREEFARLKVIKRIIKTD